MLKSQSHSIVLPILDFVGSYSRRQANKIASYPAGWRSSTIMSPTPFLHTTGTWYGPYDDLYQEMSSEELEEIFKRVYRRPLKLKRSRLYLDILSSLLGIKPVFLVDYIPTDPTKLQSLLQDFLPRLLGSRDPAPANQELCVLVLGEDVLLVNYTSLLEH